MRRFQTAAVCAGMLMFLGWSAAASAAAAGPEDSPASAAARVPVLLELFTSEGCSSCPPADELLGWLDRKQPVAGADIVVISEHVDYWNNLGWVDRNSSQLFSNRQSAFAELLHRADVYTPQLLVDGTYQLIGSRKADAESAVAAALKAKKAPLVLSAKTEGGYAQLHVSAEPLANSGAADIYLVLANDHISSRVTAGENAGRRLTHTAVAFSFQKIGRVDNAPFARDIRSSLSAKDKNSGLRVIVFAQDKKTGHIVAIAQTKS